MNVKPGHLWAIAFDGTSRAEQFREKITSLGREKRGLILLDVALAIRYEDGSFTLNGESFPLVKHMPPRTLAHLLAGLALGAPPLCSAGVSALLGVVGVDSGVVGISDKFVREVADRIKPGTSVLFVLDEAAEMDAILHGIRGMGGTVLKTNVDVDRAKLIQSTLAASDGQSLDRIPG